MTDTEVAGNCPACWHLWSLHGAGGCHANVFPAGSLDGDRCPCEHTAPETAAPVSKYPLVLGQPIRHRNWQQAAWVAGSGLLGAGSIAGCYWLGLQQDYHHLGLPWGSAKQWWDAGMGVFHSGHWKPYRDGLRDGGEPAAWTLIGATILGGTPKRIRLFPLWAYVTALVVLLAAIIAGTTGITWLTHFGPLSGVNDTGSWQQLILGIVLGRLLHFAWAPFGASIRYRIVVSSAYADGPAPLWVRYPLRPPVWREEWSRFRARRDTATAAERKTPGWPTRIVFSAGVFVFFAVTIIGLLAKWPVAHGIHIPVMHP